jgi:hypothetical protein
MRGTGQATQQKTDAQVKRDRSVEIERLVQEERTSRSKMPQYPGLDRWILVEKMGDGAFSNVYRAKDSTGEIGEVAIKVVRKFEMNSNQVGRPQGLAFIFPWLSSFFSVSFLFGVLGEVVAWLEWCSPRQGRKHRQYLSFL